MSQSFKETIVSLLIRIMCWQSSDAAWITQTEYILIKIVFISILLWLLFLLSGSQIFSCPADWLAHCPQTKQIHAHSHKQWLTPADKHFRWVSRYTRRLISGRSDTSRLHNADNGVRQTSFALLERELFPLLGAPGVRIATASQHLVAV